MSDSRALVIRYCPCGQVVKALDFRRFGSSVLLFHSYLVQVLAQAIFFYLFILELTLLRFLIFFASLFLLIKRGEHFDV